MPHLNAKLVWQSKFDIFTTIGYNTNNSLTFHNGVCMKDLQVVLDILLATSSPLHGVKYSLNKGIKKLTRLYPQSDWNDVKLAEYILNAITSIRDSHHDWKKSCLNTGNGFSAICGLLSYYDDIQLLIESLKTDSKQFEINCKNCFDAEKKRRVPYPGEKTKKDTLIFVELKKLLKIKDEEECDATDYKF